MMKTLLQLWDVREPIYVCLDLRFPAARRDGLYQCLLQAAPIAPLTSPLMVLPAKPAFISDDVHLRVAPFRGPMHHIPFSILIQPSLTVT